MNEHLGALGSSIANFVQRLVREIDNSQKVSRLAAIKRNYLYVEGKQYLLNRYGDGGRYVADYNPITPLDLQRGGYDTTTVNAPVYNQVRSLGRKLEGVLAQRSPNCQAEPLVPGDEKQEAIARAATKVVQALRKQWETDNVQKAIVNCAYLAGTPFAEIRWIEDPERFGTRVEESITETSMNGPYTECMDCNSVTPGIVSQCSQCKSPAVVPMEGEYIIRTPLYEEKVNGLPVPEIFTEENITIPLMAKKWDTEITWLVKVQDVFNGTILKRWPKARPFLYDSGIEATQTAQTQMFRYNIRGGVRRMVTEVTTAYLTPDTYELLTDAMQGQGLVPKETSIGEFLKKNAPQGIKVIIIRGHVFELEAVSLKSVISTAIPDFSDTILTDPLVTDFIPVQNAVNTQMAINQETMESALPMTLVNGKKVDMDALRDPRAQFGGRLFPVEADDMALKDALYNVPQASPEAGVVQWTQLALEMGKEIIGLLPAIYGGDVGVTQTAYEAERRLNQALQQLGILWTAIRNLWAGLYRNALRMLVSNETAALEDYGVTPRELELLRECFVGGYMRKIRITVEESIPATRAQVAALVRELLTLGPMGLTLLGADSPAMAEKTRDSLGLVGWSTPAATMQDWVRGKIAQLLQEQPMAPAMDPTGAPVPPQPSIAPDMVYGDPNLIYQLGQNWLVTEGEKLLEAEGPSPGYQNVLLWVKAYQSMAMQFQAQAQGQGEPQPQAQ